MDILAQRAGHRIAASEHVAGLGAGAHSHDAAGFGHLRDSSQHSGQRLLGDRAGDHNYISVAGRACQLKAQALCIIARGQHADQLDVAAVAGTGVNVEKPRRFGCTFCDKFFKHFRPSLQTIPGQNQAD
jgi:hypothetical protein